MATQQNRHKVLHMLLWSAQILLALLFGMAGFMKLTQSISVLAGNMTFVRDFPSWVVRFIGIAEIAAAAGLLLPGLLKTGTRLTPWAATGLTVIMFLAAIYHIAHEESQGIVITMALGLLAVFTAWLRFGKYKL